MERFFSFRRRTVINLGALSIYLSSAYLFVEELFSYINVFFLKRQGSYSLSGPNVNGVAPPHSCVFFSKELL